MSLRSEKNGSISEAGYTMAAGWGDKVTERKLLLINILLFGWPFK